MLMIECDVCGVRVQATEVRTDASNQHIVAAMPNAWGLREGSRTLCPSCDLRMLERLEELATEWYMKWAGKEATNDKT